MLKLESDKPTKILLFLHGLCEHSARCLPLAKALVEEGVSVYLPEHRGHGTRALSGDYQWINDLYLSDQSSADVAKILRKKHSKSELKSLRLQFTLACKSLCMGDHLTELREHYFQLKADFPDLPIYIGGFSLGGLLATALSLDLEESGEEVQKLLLVSPAFMATGAPIVPSNTFKHAIQKAGKQMVSLIHQWRSQENNLMASTLKQIKKLNLNVHTDAAASLASDLCEEQELFKYDPLVSDRVPLAYLSEIQQLMVETQKKVLTSRVETWLTYAEQDGIINPEGCAYFSRERKKRDAKTLHVQAESDFAVHDLIRSSRFENVRQFLVKGIHS